MGYSKNYQIGAISPAGEKAPHPFRRAIWKGKNLRVSRTTIDVQLRNFWGVFSAWSKEVVKKGAKPRVGETTVVESPTRAWSCRGLDVLGSFSGLDVIVTLRARNPCRWRSEIPDSGNPLAAAPINEVRIYKRTDFPRRGRISCEATENIWVALRARNPFNPFNPCSFPICVICGSFLLSTKEAKAYENRLKGKMS